jgi:hypothetical protein
MELKTKRKVQDATLLFSHCLKEERPWITLFQKDNFFALATMNKRIKTSACIVRTANNMPLRLGDDTG